MNVTRKGQVTIPQRIREKYGIDENSRVDFFEESGRIYIKKTKNEDTKNVYNNLRGSATIKMSTEEIMKLTRDEA